MKGQQTVISSTSDEGERKFNFDHSFWSTEKSDSHFVDQEVVFKALGEPVLDNAFNGYNACIFAYGQTGSGKTYTMMGTEGEPGVIPRLCGGLYGRINANGDPNISFRVEVSYLEIYNEKVHDLLGDASRNLRVREHNVLGPYVEGLTKMAVADEKQIGSIMEQGTKARTTASTAMNATSSRSHAVFTVMLTQREHAPGTDHVGEKTSRISLVDLAGSERQAKTGAKGERLKEGANINKSLTTLGRVISALADQSAGAGKKGKGDKSSFVPYRDSALTWLLKDSLGGNSKTVMVTAISPAADNYDETLSSLRYADRAKRIVNRAVVNEDDTARVIRELREELAAVKELLAQGGGVVGGHKPNTIAELQVMKDKVAENERLLREMNMSWEERLQLSQSELSDLVQRAQADAEARERENEELKTKLEAVASEKERVEADRAAAEQQAAAEQLRLQQLNEEHRMEADAAKAEAAKQAAVARQEAAAERDKRHQMERAFHEERARLQSVHQENQRRLTVSLRKEISATKASLKQQEQEAARERQRRLAAEKEAEQARLQAEQARVEGERRLLAEFKSEMQTKAGMAGSGSGRQMEENRELLRSAELGVSEVETMLVDSRKHSQAFLRQKARLQETLGTAEVQAEAEQAHAEEEVNRRAQARLQAVDAKLQGAYAELAEMQQRHREELAADAADDVRGDAEDAVEVATLEYRRGVLSDKAQEARQTLTQTTADLAAVSRTYEAEGAELKQETDAAVAEVNREMDQLIADVEETLATRLAALGDGGDPDAVELARLEAEAERLAVEEQRQVALEGMRTERDAGLQELKAWAAGEETRLRAVRVTADDLVRAAEAEMEAIGGQLEEKSAERRKRAASGGGTSDDSPAAMEAKALQEAFRNQAEADAAAERETIEADRLAEHRQIVADTKAKLATVAGETMQRIEKLQADHAEQQRALTEKMTRAREQTMKIAELKQQMATFKATQAETELQDTKAKLVEQSKQMEAERALAEMERRNHELANDFRSVTARADNWDPAIVVYLQRKMDRIRQMAHRVFAEGGDTDYMDIDVADYLMEVLEQDDKMIPAAMQLEKFSVGGWISRAGVFSKSWNRRWLVYDLKTQMAHLYANEKLGKEKNSFALQEVHSVTEDESPAGKLKFAFFVLTPRRTYTFRCPSKEEMEVWMLVFNSAIKR